MSREKQIEEMARTMCRNYQPNGNCFAGDELCGLECVYGYCAERIYCAGYRRQSEDTVEVIRCKDCMYLEERHYEELGDIPYIKLTCKWSNYSHQPNDYCSLAEPKMKGGE